MPFTAAHPAAVLPIHRLARSRLPLSALVIGSVAPDLAYFLPLDVPRAASHGLAGLLWFCLPLGLVLCFLFQRWLKEPLSLLLPSALRERLDGSATSSVRPIAPVAVAVLIGAITHVGWDAFTHADGAVVARVPALRAHLATVGGYPVFVFKLLQHGSTLLGVLVLAVAIARWMASAPRAPRPDPLGGRGRLAVWSACAVAALTIAVVRSADLIADHALDLALFQRALGRSVVPALASAGGVTIAFCAGWRVARRWLPAKTRLALK